LIFSNPIKTFVIKNNGGSYPTTPNSHLLSSKYLSSAQPQVSLVFTKQLSESKST